MNFEYIAVIINSTIRSTTPVLFAALGAAICSRSGVFNVALEAQLLIGSFVSIAINAFTKSLFLAVLTGVSASVVVSLVVAVLQVKYKAADMVIGTSLNALIGGLTIFLLFLFFGVRGTFSDPSLTRMPEISIPVIKDIPFVGVVFGQLSFLDYLSYIIAIFLYIYMFKTVSGFRLQSVGINATAAESLGINAVRTKMKAVLLSGVLCGLGGCALSMGQVTLFVEGMTAGRGWIGMAASSLGLAHPIYVAISSLFFGFAQAIGVALQKTIPSQLTNAVPYVATIIALGYSGYIEKKRKFRTR